METFKIKPDADKEYKLIKTAEELSVRRYAQLKEFLIQKETGVPIPSLIDTLRGFIKNFDNDSKAGMLITLNNYFMGVTQVGQGEDIDQMIFTVICLDKEENEKEYDKEQAKEKLKRMNEEGLTQGVIAREVENFLKGSPILLSYYLAKGLMSLKQSV